MRCKDIASQNVQWVPDSCSVSQAARLMAMYHLELLPVCGTNGRPLGVITDRDIVVRVTAKGRVAELTRVDEAMTSPAEFVPPECPVERAVELMSKEGVSQLLVLGDDGRLEGLVGLGDLLVRAPEACPLEMIRDILAWGPADTLEPNGVISRVPRVEDETSLPNDAPVVNPARVEADSVARGGVNDLKEFPG